MTGQLDCRRIFDLAETGFRTWPVFIVGGVLVIAGVVVARLAVNANVFKRWSPLAFGLIWIALMFMGTLVPYLKLRRALAEGNYHTIEGRITDYHALGPQTKGNEWFIVSGQKFEFTEADLSPGFKLTRRRGGRLDVGTYVRVFHRGNTILRLEVCSV